MSNRLKIKGEVPKRASIERGILEKQYAGMLKQNRVEVKNAYNCYTGKCGHKVKTIETDFGVIPMFILCPECGKENLASSFKKDIYPELRPTIEWYRPSIDEVEKASQAGRDHALNGGLFMRAYNGNTSI